MDKHNSEIQDKDIIFFNIKFLKVNFLSIKQKFSLKVLFYKNKRSF